jgi:hypothetical protein
MSIDKIGNEMDIVNNEIKTQVHTRKRSEQQPEAAHGDVISIEGVPAADLTQIKWPPFFPIGDTQSIFKIKK